MNHQVSLIKRIRAYGIQKFLREVRTSYLTKKNSNNPLIEECAKSFNLAETELWSNENFHWAFRITNSDQLYGLVNEEQISIAKKFEEQGGSISIMPLNIALGGQLIFKYLPIISSLYSQQKRHSLDPYGIFRDMEKIRAILPDGSELYLGSRKFDYAVLVNITSVCPIGCSGCYKGSITRMSSEALETIDSELKQIKRQLLLDESKLVRQIKYLVRWLNNHPEVDTVILSGGEPLLFSTKTIEKILEELNKANYLKYIRICTSAVFQGMFFRFNDELMEVLRKFAQDKKKTLIFNCHVTDESQLLAEEAQNIIERLMKIGVLIHLQMPIQEGINFFRTDINKSVSKLLAISKAAQQIRVIPYKAIVDMHSPSYEELTVPIETLSKVISVLDQHSYNSDMQRWQCFCCLHEQGNFYIYPYPNFIYLKSIDKENNKVIYHIPIYDPITEIIKIHTYAEPLIPGINDEEISNPPHDSKTLERLLEVRNAYNSLMQGSISVHEFYNISGIRCPNNDPLIVKDVEDL